MPESPSLWIQARERGLIMAVRTGAQFLKGLQDNREVWLEGERVEDVTTHPKLSRMAQTLASVYDLQHDAKYHQDMVFKSPSSGEPVGTCGIGVVDKALDPQSMAQTDREQ